MRGVRWVAALAAVATSACRVVPVDEAGSVGWSRGVLVSPAPGSPAVFYLDVANPTGAADTVATVRVTGADSAQMHQTMAMGNGMEGMSPVAVLALPAHDTVRFAPGGLHVMVFGLSDALHAGDSTQVTVGFRHGGEVTHWAHVITYAQVDSALAAKP
jgi:copper(I)-binding protein